MNYNNKYILNKLSASSSPPSGTSPAPAGPPLICDDPAAQYANFGESLGMAAANMFGLGGMLQGNTGLDKLKSQISDLNSEMAKFNQDMQFNFDAQTEQIEADIINLMFNMKGNIMAVVNYNNELLNEEISSNSTYIATLFILTLIILTYLMIQKN